MKNFTIILILFFSMNTFYAKSQQQFSPPPDWLKKAIFYQVYPQSFKDSDGDGIGDLRGLISKLDYIKSIGLNAIWVNPCFESAYQDAGYDVVDFYKVAKRYGTNADLENLFKEAHLRKIKICLDLVAGHTSDQHKWFKMSSLKTKNELTDRYIWTNSKNIKPERFVSGDFQRDGTYLKNFFDCQPALNYGYAHPNPEHPWEQPVTAPGPQQTRKELYKIIAFWMDKGADGFRVDMASSLIKEDKVFSETNKLWGEVRNWFQASYPQGVLIAEWSNPKQSINAGFMIDFMMHFNVPGYPSLFFNNEGVFTRDNCYFSIEGNGSPVEFIKNYTEQLTVVGNRGYVSIPSANHDLQRPHSGTRNTEDQLKVVMTFLLTLKGIPFIYYGDEIGMRYIPNLPNKEGSVIEPGINRAGTRTPMQWTHAANAGFSDGKVQDFYLPIDPMPNRPDVLSQEKNPHSLLNFTRKLIKLRLSSEALGNTGEFTALYAKANTYPLVYKRSTKNEEYIIVVNPSGKDVNAIFTFDGIRSLEPVIVNNIKIEIIPGKNSLQLAASKVSYGIFKVKH